MQTLTLPHTQLEVSQLALGCMRLRHKTFEEVETLLETALSQGINFFDHADIYGDGACESLFGQVLAKHPDWRPRMVIQSKCGIIRGKRYDLSKEHILTSATASLQRLQTDHLDILLLHRPDALFDPREVAAALHELKQDGRVHHFGVSNFTPLQMQLLEKYLDFPLIINQLQYSILHSSMIDQGFFANMSDPQAVNRDGGVLDYCHLKDITIQAWSPLQASWEDGSFIDNPKFPHLNHVLADLAKRHQVTKAAVALAWIFRHPAQMQAIVGTTSPAHLIEACQAESLTLSRQEWYDLYLAEEKYLP